MTAITNSNDCSCKGKVVCNDLCELREMPTIPLPSSHDVVIQFLIQIIKQRWNTRVVDFHSKLPNAHHNMDHLKKYSPKEWQLYRLSYCTLLTKPVYLQIACTIMVSTLSGLNFSLYLERLEKKKTSKKEYMESCIR